jgi:long-chain acyl-CoA synthetase
MYPGTFAITDPEKPAVIIADTGQSLSYKELNSQSIKIARFLKDLGLNKGDTIAFLIDNRPEFLAVAWAAQRTGLYYTAISTRLAPDEINYILQDSNAKVFFISDARFDFLNSLEQPKNLREIITIEPYSPQYRTLEQILNSTSDLALQEEVEGIDLLYSSGTTGKPKGIKFNLTFSPIGPSPVSLLLAGIYQMTKDSIYLTPAPLYHAAPLRFSLAVHRIGATLVVLKHFEPESFLKTIQDYQVTHTQVVPTMFIRLLKAPFDLRNKYNLSSLRCVIHASAPCPIEVKTEMIQWLGPIIYEYYAGTEGNGFVCCNSQEWLSHPGTVGKALLGKIHILDENNNEVPVGQDGLVYFEGATNFEYLNDPEKTQSSRTKEGWSTLGDIGHLDQDGYLYLTDRQSFMIISGGVNIYPQEIENVLITHPKVLDCAVFGIPDEEFGEQVKAVVQPVNMSEAGEELEKELISYVKSKIASFKAPKSIDFKEELPRAATGKLYKRLLRDSYVKR